MIMNRTINFRGKRIDTGEWVYGDLIENQGRYYIYYDTSDTTLENEDDTIIVLAEEVDPDTVGQYTGLKDRNGKDVWEGDIVKTPLLDPIFGDVLSDAFDNVAISFHNGSFVVAYYNGRHKIYLQDLYDKIEVIGNIHDNPKLLEEKK